MRFYRAKIDVNDTLFSKLVRHGKKLCDRCGKERDLQCCHIIGRAHYATRFDLRNAVAMCAGCHDWFDSHKITAVIFDPNKRVFGACDESYHFLVKCLGYDWDEIARLYVKGQAPSGYKFSKKLITKTLKQMLKERGAE